MHTTKLSDQWIVIHHGQVDDDDEVALKQLSHTNGCGDLLQEITVPIHILKQFVERQQTDTLD
jgi:hypothetical protein